MNFLPSSSGLMADLSTCPYLSNQWLQQHERFPFHGAIIWNVRVLCAWSGWLNVYVGILSCSLDQCYQSALFYCLKLETVCIIKVIKATICTSKLFTKKQETDRGPRGDKMCSLWPVAVPWLPRVSLPRSRSSERSTTLLSEPRDELRWPKTIRVKPFNHKLWPWSVF